MRGNFSKILLAMSKLDASLFLLDAVARGTDMATHMMTTKARLIPNISHFLEDRVDTMSLRRDGISLP